MDQRTMVQPNNGTTFGNRKNKVMEPTATGWLHCAEWKMPDSKDYIPYDILEKGKL